MSRLMLTFIVFSFFSLSSFAASFTYRLYEDSIREFTPHTVTIELSGAFKKGSAVKSLVIKEVLRNKTTVLFSLSGKALHNAIKFRWVGNQLALSGTGDIFNAVVTEPVSNGWGDTDIAPGDDYSVYTDGEILLTPAGTVGETRFEIANQTVEESCMWGILKK